MQLVSEWLKKPVKTFQLVLGCQGTIAEHNSRFVLGFCAARQQRAANFDVPGLFTMGFGD